MDYSSISGKVALITGASGGIGAGTAALFAKHGAKLALTGRDQAALIKTSQKCKEAGAKNENVLTVTGDITNADDIRKIVDGVVKHYGGIDILVNAAGIIRPGGFLVSKIEDYDDVFNTNVRAAFMVCKAAVPHIIERKGNIVNVSSFTGIKPSFTYFAYSLAEASLDQFTRALALELGPKGVRVNSVNPGLVKDTKLWTRKGAPLAQCTEEEANTAKENMGKVYPLRRIAQVNDVAPTILFLASENASFVHGIILPVDGGKILTAKPSGKMPPPPAKA